MNRPYAFIALLLAMIFAWSPNALSQAPDTVTASQSGRSLESELAQLFEKHSIELVPIQSWSEARLYQEPDLTAVVRNAPYKSIYGHRARIEFLIEAKRQRSSGSVDEKLPYVFANAEANIALGREFILIIDGDGWKPGAIDWITSQAAATDGFTVMRPDGFDLWLQEHLASSNAITNAAPAPPSRGAQKDR